MYNNIGHKAPQSDFIQLDDLLIDLKLNEDALEVPIPRYFLTENKEALDQRNQLLVNFDLILSYIALGKISRAIWEVHSTRGRRARRRLPKGYRSRYGYKNFAKE